MTLSTTAPEHVHRVRLPVASAEDAAEEVAFKTFAQGGGRFTFFPRLPAEIQDMIWKATIEPKTFRAWTVKEEMEEGLEWLLVECTHYRRTHIPISRVCRRSRAIAVQTYGVPSQDNPILFSPRLDTVFIHGHEGVDSFDEKFWLTYESPEASDDAPGPVVELSTAELMPESRAEHGALKPLYWLEEHDLLGLRIVPVRYWVAFRTPFERARNVVLSGKPSCLYAAAAAASTLLPNIEELTIRACLSRKGQRRVEQDMARWKDIVKRIICLSQTEGWWPRLGAIDFERQSLPNFKHPSYPFPRRTTFGPAPRTPLA